MAATPALAGWLPLADRYLEKLGYAERGAAEPSREALRARRSLAHWMSFLVEAGRSVAPADVTDGDRAAFADRCLQLEQTTVFRPETALGDVQGFLNYLGSREVTKRALGRRNPQIGPRGDRRPLGLTLGPSRGPGFAELERQITDFMLYLKYELGLGENTVKSYFQDLKLFLSFLDRSESAPKAAEIVPQTVRRYLEWCRERRGHAPRSIARHLVSLRQFTAFLFHEGAIPADPLAGMKTPKVPRSLPHPLTEEEMSRLLQAPAKGGWPSLRDRAILEVFYASGMRLSELVSLSDGAVDLAQQQATVVGKGSRERVVPLSRAACEALRAYLAARPPAKDRAALFVNRRGQRLRARWIEKLMKAYLRKAGLSTRHTPHSIRHSFATHLLDHDADIRIIQEFLGHANLSTTQVYTRVSQQKRRQVYRQAHPRDRMP